MELLLPGPDLLLRVLGSVLCHQLPERSLALGGVALPLCARCTGLYLGAGGAGLGLLIGRPRPRAGRRGWAAWGVALALLLLTLGDGSLVHYLGRGLGEEGRALLAAGAGAGLVALLAALLAWRSPAALSAPGSRPAPSWPALALGVLAGPLLLGLVHLGPGLPAPLVPPLRWLVGAGSLLGCLLLMAGVCLLVAGLVLPRRLRQRPWLWGGLGLAGVLGWVLVLVWLPAPLRSPFVVLGRLAHLLGLGGS